MRNLRIRRNNLAVRVTRRSIPRQPVEILLSSKFVCRTSARKGLGCSLTAKWLRKMRRLRIRGAPEPVPHAEWVLPENDSHLREGAEHEIREFQTGLDELSVSNGKSAR